MTYPRSVWDDEERMRIDGSLWYGDHLIARKERLTITVQQMRTEHGREGWPFTRAALVSMLRELAVMIEASADETTSPVP